MGLIEDLDTMDLSDEAKASIRASHEAEVNGHGEELAKLRAQARVNTVNNEIDGLKKLGFAEAPGLLKFVRRVFLSDDEDAGAVLLSDTDMNLSGDDATGASKREEISVAGAIRQFLSLMPSDEDGKIVLSEQALVTDADDKPESGEKLSVEDETEEARKRTSEATGLPVTKRTRKRYAGRGA